MHINTIWQRHITREVLNWMAKTHYKLDIIEKPSEHAQHDLTDLFNVNPVHTVFSITNPRRTFNFLENELQFGKLINHMPFHRSDITYRDINFTNNYHQTVISWSQPYKYVATLIKLALKSALIDEIATVRPMGLSYQGEFINGQQK